MIEFADSPVAPKSGDVTCDCKCDSKPLKGQDLLGITDPMYDSIIDDLISAGNILLKCKHHTSGVRVPCKLCRATWEGTVMNAKAIREGKALLKKGGK